MLLILIIFDYISSPKPSSLRESSERHNSLMGYALNVQKKYYEKVPGKKEEKENE